MKKTSVILLLLALAGTAAAGPWCDWWNPFTYGGCILEGIVNLLVKPLVLAGYVLLAALVLSTPNLAVVNPMMAAYISFLVPIFTISILGCGFYLMFMAGSPPGRARAKGLFWRLMLTMILISVSPELFQIMVEVAYSVSLRMLQIGVDVDLSVMLASPIFLHFIPIYFMALMFSALSVAVRWMGLLMMAAVFPLTLFFYLVELPFISGFTKSMGQMMMKWTLGYIFAQPFQALMLSIAIIALGGSETSVDPVSDLLMISIGICGLIMVGLVPLMVMGMLSWIGSSFMAAGMGLTMKGGMGWAAAGAGVTAAGGMMMGMGPGALFAAGGTASMGYAMSQGRAVAHELGVRGPEHHCVPHSPHGHDHGPKPAPGSKRERNETKKDQMVDEIQSQLETGTVAASGNAAKDIVNVAIAKNDFSHVEEQLESYGVSQASIAQVRQNWSQSGWIDNNPSPSGKFNFSDIRGMRRTLPEDDMVARDFMRNDLEEVLAADGVNLEDLNGVVAGGANVTDDIVDDIIDNGLQHNSFQEIADDLRAAGVSDSAVGELQNRWSDTHDQRGKLNWSDNDRRRAILEGDAFNNNVEGIQS